MLKGYVHITNKIQYRIYATERKHPKFGPVVSEIKLDYLDMLITVYESGDIVIKGNEREIIINVKNGKAIFN